MRLQNYILEYADYKKSGRGKGISEEEALKLAPKFSQAILSATTGNPLIIRYRSGRESFYLIDPKKDERRSANTLNYYTFIMDNSKKWSKYPKRSKSIIARIETDKVGNSYYVVLPENGAKIGECSDKDLWISFSNISANMDSWNMHVRFILNLPLYTDKEINSKKININQQQKYDKNIATFKKACKKFDYWVKNETTFSVNEIKNILKKKYITVWFSWFEKWNGEPIYNYFDKVLYPKINDFNLRNIFNINPWENEVWTDSTSLMIKDFSVFKDYINKAKELI